MSKSAKKTPATASWRTLMRRADEATSTTEAKKLREQAAKLRRDERYAAKNVKHAAEAKRAAVLESGARKLPSLDLRSREERAAEAGPRGSGIVIPTRDEAKSWGWNVPEEPGRGEIVGGEVAKLADTLAALARKKGGTDAVQAELMRLLTLARFEGQRTAEEASTKERAAIHESQRVKVVASFMAQIDAMAQSNAGKMPKVVPVSGFVLAHLMNTLMKAGYSIEGRHQ
jgi:BMFP domain-containing protein YqiC